jgi:hypothetical protein
MKILAIKDNGELIVEMTQANLKLITDTTDDFVEDQEVNISSKMTILNQLSRKKEGIVAKLTELSNAISQL